MALHGFSELFRALQNFAAPRRAFFADLYKAYESLAELGRARQSFAELFRACRSRLEPGKAYKSFSELRKALQNFAGLPRRLRRAFVASLSRACQRFVKPRKPPGDFARLMHEYNDRDFHTNGGGGLVSIDCCFTKSTYQVGKKTVNTYNLRTKKNQEAKRHDTHNSQNTQKDGGQGKA